MLREFACKKTDKGVYYRECRNEFNRIWKMLKSMLDTPCLVLDINLFEKNLIAMRDFAAAHGKKLRPHAKTHKCPEIARRQISCGNCAGVCAAKLSEAEKLADAGISDILITSPLSDSGKIRRAGELNKKIPGLKLTVDHPEQVKRLADCAFGERPLHLLVDADPEFGRTGVPFDQVPEFGRFIASFPQLRLDGVQCYAGHLQHISSFDERCAESTRLMRAGAAVYSILAAEFDTCRIFTGTGTGTLPADLLIPEVADVQVGSYCMMDAEYLAIEHGPVKFQPALRIISGVVSANHRGHATIDAGTKAVYVTPGAPAQVISGNVINNDLSYHWDFGDEHGHLTLSGQTILNPGDRVELIVSHCDPTVNLFDELMIVDGEEVIDRWEIALRGCCR